MRQFLSWSESVERLQTDDEALRQMLAFGGWRTLRSYVRAERRSFLGTLDGTGVSMSDGNSGVFLYSRWDNDEPTKLTNGKTLDAWAGGDELCEWEKTERSHRITGYAAVYTMRGFWVVLPDCVRAAAVEGTFDGVGVTPPSWWLSTDPPVPLYGNGEPALHFYLLRDSRHRLPPQELSELWFRAADIDRLMVEPPSAASIPAPELAAGAIESLRAMMKRNSAKGVEKRHERMRQLRDFAVGEYRAGRWVSANEAAHKLEGRVLAEGERIGARLMQSNAQRTIAGWFRAADRESEAAEG